MKPAEDTDEGASRPTTSFVDRRRFERQPIRLSAEIKTGQGQLFACEVRDYCAGGLSFRRKGPDPEHLLRSNATVEVRIQTSVANGTRSLRLKARVAWTSGESCGVEFRQPSEDLVKVMAEHQRVVRDLSPGGDELGVKRLTLIQQYQGIFEAQLRDLYSGVLESFQERLAQELVLPHADAERQQLYVDLGAVAAQRQTGAPELVRQVVLGVSRGSRVGDTAAPKDVDHLSLLEFDEFERWLQSSKLITQLEVQHAEVLTWLGRALNSKASVSEEDAIATAPFNPRQLVSVLGDFCTQTGIGANSMRLLFETAGQYFGKNLGVLYDALRTKSLELGYAASAVSMPAQVRHGKAPSSATPETSAGDTSSASSSPSPRTASSNSRPADGDVPVTFGNDGVARELVDFVTRNDDSFLPRSPNWLKALEERLHREMAVDSRLLQQPDHPLRAIVDGLDHLMVFGNDQGPDQTNAEAYREVESWLARLDQAPADSPLARDIARNIEERVEKLSRQYQRNVERVVAASDGREKLRLAREKVAAELNGRYLGKRVPEVALELLAVGWQAMLELILLRHGDGHELYQNRLALYDAIIAKLGGEAHDPEQGIGPVHRLIDAIKRSLEEAAFDTLKRHAVEKRLLAELGEADKASIVFQEFPSIELTFDPAEIQRPNELTPKTWRDILHRVDELRVGDQLYIKGAEQGGRAARLAWISRDASWLTLVDNRGLHLKDVAASALALDLYQGRILHEPAPTRPISERAVDAMLARMERQLEHQASHDSLTGLLNRLQFQAKLEAQCGVDKDRGGPKVLIWVDIDNFSLINDIHGYGAGDNYLVSVARLLEETLGAGVLLGHMGGDRFAALLTRTKVADGMQEARALCGEIAKIPDQWTERSLVITASIGVIGLADLDAGLQQLLQAAESVVRAAKAAGGNQVARFRSDEPGLSQHRRTLEWVVQVDDALANGALQLRCQPIVPVDNTLGLSSHYEVLLGIMNSEGEHLPIGEFISAAERYQRMNALDRWITRTVFEWIDRQRERMEEFQGFAVNLSGQTVVDPGYLEFVRELFDRHRMSPHWISFEVTETAAVSDLQVAAKMIEGIKGLGCKVALDDFGSGTASYSYLRELPVDLLKIDGVFVRNIAKNADDLAVVRSINEIGHFLGKRTIAEYVMDDDILRHLTDLGVDYAQGYAISPPVRMDDLLK